MTRAQGDALFTAPAMFLNLVLSALPNPVAPTIIARAIKAAISPYSIAVAPVSSSQKRCNRPFIAQPLMIFIIMGTVPRRAFDRRDLLKVEVRLVGLHAIVWPVFMPLSCSMRLSKVCAASWSAPATIDEGALLIGRIGADSGMAALAFGEGLRTFNPTGPCSEADPTRSL